MRNRTAFEASLSVMNKEMRSRGWDSRKERSDWLGLWIMLALGLLLMLAAAIARAEDMAFTAKRTERFNATMAAGSTLRIENISGDIVAKPGRELSAVVTITASARTQEKANELLRGTEINQHRKDDEFTLTTEWPFPFGRRGDHGRAMTFDMPKARRGETRCEECKIAAQYEVTVPKGVRAILHTVNGDVRAEAGLDGALDLQTVNGGVTALGAVASVTAQSVNGKVVVASQSFPSDASMNLKTINGPITLTLAGNARFDLDASTMNGTIVSTFPLPARVEPPEPPEPPRKAESSPDARPRARRVIVREDGDDVVVDVEELRREIEESMKEVQVEMDSVRNVNRELRRMKIFESHRSYSGSIGHGGGKMRLSTLNGSIAVLASGTKESEARPLVPERHRFAVAVPEVHVRTARPVVRVMPRAVVAPAPDESEELIVRGDVSGDFLATSGGGTYQIGRVSGTVKILTNSGEIHVASAGAGADLKTSGGDIQIGPVGGDLKAQTLAGDIRAGAVGGSISVETSGGDIRVERVGGSAGARTGGGDIILPSVRGGIEAHTGGGDVRVALVAREVKGGVSIRDSGGDVTLTLPSDFRGEVSLEVREGDQQESLIRSEFSEIAVSRQRDSQRASGILNGGGPRVLVQTQSGTIRLRKGPPAGS
ncbi:MAG TPA: DUF4097 family beta strand repeat-containing protein [Thermoanaerobaculia bacterium]|nr:DUF4097 family beta strand repeat-containing protein [Thermoanaerobaculia bacterium]